jgi:hypothetical protein
MGPNPALVSRIVAFVTSTWPSTVIITVITVGAISAVVVVNTPAGCAIGLGEAANCRKTAAVSPYHAPSSQPTYVYSPPPYNPAASAPYNPAASAPYYPPASEPYNPPASSPQGNPPGNVHNPNSPPYLFDSASGAYTPNLPFVPDVSSGGPPVNVGLSCRLPIYAGGPGSGGFLVLPDGTFVADPRSAGTAPTPSPAPSPPPAGPGYGYQNWFGLTYDRVVGKWLPVPRQWVSPDGKHYAYPGLTEGIYIVDASTSALSEVGGGKHWVLFDVQNDGVFAEEFAQPGLWSLPFSGAARQITANGFWVAVGGGAAYGTATSAVPSGVTGIIIRLDLATGTSQNWFAVTGQQPGFAGFDNAGHPLFWVWSQYYGNYLWVVYGLGNATVLVGTNSTGTLLADSHGIWLSGNNAIFLIVPGKGVYPVSTFGGQPAGECA